MTFLIPPRQINLPAKFKSPRTHPVVMIVVHGTGGIDSRSTLVTGDGRSVSTHKLIQKFPRANGSTDVGVREIPQITEAAIIYNMVPDNMVANHAGYSTAKVNGITYKVGGINVNEVSLSVELENLQDGRDRYTEDQLLCLGWVIHDWRNKWGPLPIYRHGDIDPIRRSDPVGLSIEAIEYWVKRVADELIVDNWSLWGNRFPLRRNWAIPQVWYKRARLLGMPLSDEMYPVSSINFSIQFFERGFCVYVGTLMKAKAFLYTEI